MKSILDPGFRYTPSFETDIRKTFARVRREQRAGGASLGKQIDPSLQNVVAIVKRRQSASG